MGSDSTTGYGGAVMEDVTSLAMLALDSVDDSIIVHSPTGEIRFFNRAAAHLAGLSVEEFGELPPWGWTTPMSGPDRKHKVESLRREGSLTFRVHHEVAGSDQRTIEVRNRWVDFDGVSLIVVIARDVTEEVAVQAALEHSACHDFLTGLGNRRLLEDRLDTVVEGVTRHGDRSAIVCIDLDDFKIINDTKGHAIGDEALRLIAKRLKGAFRAGDTVVRFGGDEFVVVLPRLSTEESLVGIAEKTAELLAAPMEIAGGKVSVTASVGGVMIERGDNINSAMNRADMLLYEAKRSGRGSLRVDTQ